MTRAELARELRKWSIWAAEHYADLCCLDGQRLELRSALEHAAALLEDDTTERDARRYRVLKPILEGQGERFAIAERSSQLGTLHFLSWPEPLKGNLDAAIDAWMKGEGEGE